MNGESKMSMTPIGTNEARIKFNEEIIKIRMDRVEHRKGRGKNLWTHCGVTRPIEQRCSCGEGADD